MTRAHATNAQMHRIRKCYADGETLSTIRTGKNMPKRNTIYRWRQSYPEFRDSYLLTDAEHTDVLIEEVASDTAM